MWRVSRQVVVTLHLVELFPVGRSQVNVQEDNGQKNETHTKHPRWVQYVPYIQKQTNIEM